MNTITKKFVMGLSGLGLGLFVIFHLLGNLTLLLPGSDPFNTYAAKLESLGPLLIVAEVGLVIIALLHVFFALQLTWRARAARPIGYVAKVSKGEPSKAGPSASYMVVTGCTLLAFLVLHILQFKFGAGIAEGYQTSIHGEPARDLHRLVFETFQNPLFVGIYVAVMIMLGVHLRHGYWSACQSLGALNPKITKPIYCLSLVLAVALAIGFLVIPVWMYFDLSTKLFGAV